MLEGPDELRHAERQQREVERLAAQYDEADDEGAEGPGDGRQRQQVERVDAVVAERDRHHVGAEAHEHRLAEADQPRRADEQIEAERDQAKVEALLHAKLPLDVVEEWDQCDQDDADERDRREAEAARTGVGLGGGLEPPDPVADQAEAPAQALGGRTYAGDDAGSGHALCPRRPCGRTARTITRIR